MKTTVSEIRRQENEWEDIPLSVLYKWQQALGVPIQELLVESDEELSLPVRRRAQLLRIMKTAMTIRERSRHIPTQRLAQMLIDQLLELMPELRGVSPWPAVGKSRLPTDLGQAFYRRLSDEFWRKTDEDSG